MRTVVFAAALILTTTATTAQAPSPSSGPSFDVVSVKEVPPAWMTGGPARPGSPDPGGGWSARSTTFEELVGRAFPEFALPGLTVGLPTWATERRFDVDAKIDPPPARSEYPRLLQRMLAERFNLKTHVESRILDVYWLVLARTDQRLGPQLRPASQACLAELAAERARVAALTGPLIITTSDIGPCGRRISVGSRVLNPRGAVTLAELARTIQFNAWQLVIDRTGLEGLYEYELEFENPGLRGIGAPNDSPSQAPNLFTAVQEQLGLKLERHRQPTDVLVIDSVTLPSAN